MLIIINLYVICSIIQNASSDDNDKILDIIYKKYNQYKTMSHMIQGSVKHRLFLGSGHNAEEKECWQWKYLANSQSMLIIKQESDPSVKPAEVVGYNNKYAFSIFKNTADGRGWILKEVYYNNKYYDWLRQTITSQRDIGVMRLFFPYGHDVIKLLVEKTVNDVSIINERGNYIISYTHNVDIKKERSSYISCRSRVYFNADHCIIDRYEASIDNRDRTRSNVVLSNKYKFVNNVPIPVTIETTTKRGNVTEYMLSECNMYIDNNVPDHEFTLSAFGLEEPHGITWERPTPWWIYFGLIGGGCLVGFVLIGVFLRRRYGAS